MCLQRHDHDLQLFLRRLLRYRAYRVPRFACLLTFPPRQHLQRALARRVLAGRLILLVDHLIRLVDLLELLLDVEASSRLLGGGAALHLVKLDTQRLLVLRAVGAGKRLVSERSRR
jgi:hypothetical protein